MAVKVCCPSCNKSLLAPDAAPSRKGKCPQCGSEFQVASAVLSDSVEPEFKLDTGRVPSSNQLTPRQPAAIPRPVLSAPSSTEYSPPARIENTNESRTACPECNSPLRVATAALGGSAKCPQCGAVFVVARDLRPPSIEYVSQAASQPAYQSPSPATQVGDCPFRQSSSSTYAATSLSPLAHTEIQSRLWLLQAAVAGTWLIFMRGGVGGGDVPSPAVGWPLAAFSTVLGVALMHRVLRPPTASVAQAAGPFLMTAVAGVFALSAFQQVAESAKGLDQRTAGSPRLTILYWLIKLVGYAYEINHSFIFDSEHNVPFFVGLIATIVSNGLCEELVKLAPAAYLIVTKKDLQYRDALFMGAASGLGFGVAEGLLYVATQYGPGGHPLSIYLARFSGIAWGHGVYTIISTAVAFALRDSLQKAASSPSAGWKISGMLALCSLVPSVPHAFYNSFGQVHWLLSLGVLFASVYLAIVLAYPELIDGEHDHSASRQSGGGISGEVVVAEVVESTTRPRGGPPSFDQRPAHGIQAGSSAMPWLVGCGIAGGVAVLLVILATTVAKRPGGVVERAIIRVTGHDGTPELQEMMGEPIWEQITQLRVRVMVSGMDVFAAKVRIENIGHVPVRVSPDNLYIHLGAQSTGVISTNDSRFLRRSTLRPGEYIEGLVMYPATPTAGAVVQLGAGELSYQDASIEVAGR